MFGGPPRAARRRRPPHLLQQGREQGLRHRAREGRAARDRHAPASARDKTIAVPDCKVGEDLVFSDDNRTWYLTCMGSQNVVVGDAVNDRPPRSIALPKPYPHGIAIHEGIDRMLVTSTVRATDLKDAGETITALELSTGKALASHKVSAKPSPAGEAPVEIGR